MLKNVSANIFYTCMRYRLLSHVFPGVKRRIYKEKYHQLKNIIKQFETERIYLLGIKVLTIRDCGTLRCHFLFGFPVWTQIFHEKSYHCRLLNITVYKKKFSSNKNTQQIQENLQNHESASFSDDDSTGMTNTERNICSLLEAINFKGK